MCLTVRSIEKSGASSNVLAGDPTLLPNVIKATIVITIHSTLSPVKLPCFRIAATNALAVKFFDYGRSSDVAIEDTLRIAFLISEAAIVNEVSDISLSV